MATPSKSGGGQSQQSDALGKYLQELRSKNDETRQKGAKSLKFYVDAEARQMSGESFTKFMNDLNRRIFELVNSSDVHEKLGGIMAIDEIIDVECEENATKITRFANYLRMVLPNSDPTTLQMASKALGHLARSGGTLTADFVEFEVKRALEWLQGDRYEGRRFAAVLVLKELAENAPTLFYVHVSSFFEHVWVAIRDSKVVIREGAIEALRTCLALIAQRDSRWRVQWYFKIFEEAQKGFKQNNADSIHGSLLAMGELLRNTGEFMMARFKDVCDVILRYRDHKDKLVRRTVIGLIPRLAGFAPEEFVSRSYLSTCLNHLLTVLKQGQDRSVSFVALGELALAVGDNVNSQLDAIIALIKDGLTPKARRPFCHEALTCVSMLARAVGPVLEEHMQSLLDQMFSAGLGSTLTTALTELAHHIPSLLPEIRERLLDTLSHILQGTPYTPVGGKAAGHKWAQNRADPSIQSNEAQDPALVTLALKTLGSFDFGGYRLTEFVKEVCVNFLDDDNPAIRREASLTCSRLLVQTSDPDLKAGQLSVDVGEVLEKLLIVAIADPDSSIRESVLSSLDERFDDHLAQAENLRALFIALNDEVFAIQELAITVIGRLTARNPAYVMPSLRKYLIQLLTELEYSGDSRHKEEAAKLLGHLIQASRRLIQPYVGPILRALLPKLQDSNPGVATYVLGALGELALVGGKDVKDHVDELFPMIIESLQDQSSPSKREVALRTLRQLVTSTGYVVEPYVKYSSLLNIVLNALKGEQRWAIRREVIMVLGVMGALDPYKHKMNQMNKSISDVTATATHNMSSSSHVLPGIGPSSEDYYPTVAISTLMRILRDSSLSTHHNMVIQAVMFIFKSLGQKCVPFLPEIMPAFFHVMRTCEPGLRDFLFQQLGVLVSIVKQHIRPYLVDLFALIREYWQNPSLLIQIVTLVEEISVALNDEFKAYLPDLIPQLLNILHTDRTDRRLPTLKVLHALEVFGTNLDDYLYLVIPAVVRLFEQVDASLHVRHSAIQTLGRLCKTLNFADYASRIIHPLARVLDGTYVDLRKDAMETLCALVFQLGSDYAIFVPMVNKVLSKHRIQYPRYDVLVSNLLKNQPLPSQDGSIEYNSTFRSGDGPGDEPSTLSSVDMGAVKKLPVNQQSLKKAWEASQRSTREDWFEWMRRFSVELLRESPTPALRSCSALAQVYHPLARELFNAAFVSCWTELFDQYQDILVRSLETAFSSPTIPPEILQTLLNLAEFMEHDDKPLPIDIRTLGAHAEKCHAYAKALHYKELEFHTSPATTIEALISINNQLQQPDAAVGVLLYAQANLSVELKESWYEKLRRWEDALQAYEKKQNEDPGSIEIALGKMRCWNALGEWEELASVAENMWDGADISTRKQFAPLAASAALNLSQFDKLSDYVEAINPNVVDGSFYRAVMAVHLNKFDEGHSFIERTWELLDTELTALVGESYNRAYKVVVRVQELAELKEIIEYKQCPETRPKIKQMWKERLDGMQRNVDVWQRILSVRSLVVSAREDMDTWLKFSSLCRKNQRLPLALKTLARLLEVEPSAADSGQALEKLHHVHPQLAFAYLKYLWSKGGTNATLALSKLASFVSQVQTEDNQLKARCYLKLGEWQRSQNETLDDEVIPQILESFRLATEFNNQYYRAWHAWAYINFEAVAFYEKNNGSDKQVAAHLVPAVRGFFLSIALGGDQSLQDILRLLTLWFKHGHVREVEAALMEGFHAVSIDTWLQVIPQLIARIHTPNSTVRRLINDLLCKVGKEHPQALIYPLTVASKSQSTSRKAAAQNIMDNMRTHSVALVEQAFLVSQELIRVAILWHEMWHEGLEEASRLYFGDHNVEGMFAALKPLHEMMEKGPETLREVSFQQAFGRDLQEALEWCKKYQKSKKEAELNQAWDLYYHVFRRINKQLPQLTTLELQYVSPKLLNCRDLELAVPGTYNPHHPIVMISGFMPTLQVITSKQRPRKLTISGSDGQEYVFLLKGHEDLRQDERVMQLFGLVNTLLANDPHTSKRDLSIQRYAVIPLAPNSGLIGWVPQTDTLHTLIREYREARKILLNIEHRLMLQMAPDYDNLTLMQKVEVFEYALDNTTGQDLYKILWLKSRNSEVWLERRTNYTRSLAVMSMVGYILGLGDRHPSNLMLDRHSGKILHIDFGDCFEVAMHREKYPEKIPFRLTRMLTNAMEVSGIEGNFRFTCESVMLVLRDNKDSVMAMLEAFVYDPLINWRLLTNNSPPKPEMIEGGTEEEDTMSPPRRSSRSRGDTEAAHSVDVRGVAAPEILNERAVAVIRRVSNKLTGRDFGNDALDVTGQVDRLIGQATSHENLCQCYIGWCPFW